jgi:hypothetical protein
MEKGVGGSFDVSKVENKLYAYLERMRFSCSIELSYYML